MSLGGVGFLRPAPGTWGSVVVLPVAWAGPGAAALLAVLLLAVGLWALRRLPEAEADPGWVVIDEFAGQWITLLGMEQMNWQNLLAAFILFRLFDICKPRPIAWADQRKDALGVMADDMIAGTMAALALAIIFWQWPALLH